MVQSWWSIEYHPQTGSRLIKLSVSIKNPLINHIRGFFISYQYQRYALYFYLLDNVKILCE
ncbi:hypothetical protein BC659_2439 [Sediminibacterium goheungense]|uniref:Uncharacterized protein n=1 Tax=Sediminibacterium goheungense TaxID=1086393 RepID=A0A4R6IWN3_9BACT|nr:hypothetical protein BC659_2439 [Sediminibacterium goheungense]